MYMNYKRNEQMVYNYAWTLLSIIICMDMQDWVIYRDIVYAQLFVITLNSMN